MAQPNFFDNHFAFQNNGTPVGGSMGTDPKKRGDKVVMMAGEGDGSFTVTLMTPDGEETI